MRKEHFMCKTYKIVNYVLRNYFMPYFLCVKSLSKVQVKYKIVLIMYKSDRQIKFFYMAPATF